MTETWWPLPLSSCSHVSPGSFWLKPKSGCFLFLPRGGCFLFLYLSVFVRTVLSVSTVQCTLSLPRYAYLLSETGGEWFVIGASSGYVLLSKRGGELILALSKADADFLSFYFTSFQFVSVSCWAPGWVGGWVGYESYRMTGGIPPHMGGYGCEMPREGPTIL